MTVSHAQITYYTAFIQQAMNPSNTLYYAACLSSELVQIISEFVNLAGIGPSQVKECQGMYQVGPRGDGFVTEKLSDQRGRIRPIESGVYLSKEFYLNILQILAQWSKNDAWVNSESPSPRPAICFHVNRHTNAKEEKVPAYYADEQTAYHAARFLTAFNGTTFSVETMPTNPQTQIKTRLSIEEQLRLLDLSFEPDPYVNLDI